MAHGRPTLAHLLTWPYYRMPVNSCLGILSMQTYSYFKRYPHDKPFYKLLVRRFPTAIVVKLSLIRRLYASRTGRLAVVRAHQAPVASPSRR